jgi:hypothetical protein
MPTFTIVGSEIGYGGGNYKNDQPGQDAKKAGKALFKKLTLRKYAKYKNRPTIKFILRMRDRKSLGKTYSYMVTRTKLAKPLIIKKGDISYEVNFDYKVATCNLSSGEVKTMTGGEYEMVGGQLACTGLKRTGGNVEMEEFEDDEEGGGGEGEGEGEAVKSEESSVAQAHQEGGKGSKKSKSSSKSKSPSKTAAKSKTSLLSKMKGLKM